ncbi:MAG: TonB-dependent receptor family protein [Candidatus Azobacteroides sp.]|nr:TonB-dependent receptor family protein [Candidatus Azobacteroides sp.]
MRFTRFFLLFGAIAATIQTHAQMFKVSGIVKGEDGAPIEFANAVLKNGNPDNLAGAMTDENGKFEIKVSPDKYTLFISFVGYTTDSTEITVDKDIDAGVIQLKTNTQLKEVTVYAPKTLIVRKMDRVVFNVGNSVAATGGDALDALKLAPGVQVRNDNVSLIGKSNMLVLVDDKEIHLSGDDLMNYLKSIPSDNIKNIEVITTPPAKYEAEGNSGIINIVLKKEKENSWNLRVNVPLTQGYYFRWYPNVNFTLQKGKWSVLAGISDDQGKRIYTNHITYQYPDDTYWKIMMSNRHKYNSISENLNVSYKITDKLSAGIQYTGNLISSTSPATNTTNIYNNPALDTLNAFYDNHGVTKTNPFTHTFNFNMQQKLDSMGKKINLDVDYFINQNKQENPFYTTNYYYNPASPQVDYYTTNNSNVKITNYSMRLDFEMPYKWATLNYGGKLSFTQTHSDIAGSFYQTVNSADSLYLFQTDNFTYKENNQALYFSIEKNMGKKWSAKAGLRMENTQTSSISQPNTQPEQTHQFNYTKFFPTAYLSYKPNDNNTFTLDYSRRVARPDYEALNPAKWYISLNQIVYGNPFLQPSFVHNISFNHSYKDLISSQIWYSYVQNRSTQLNTFNDYGNVETIRDNFANVHAFGISESFNRQVFPWWNTSSGASTWFSKTFVFPALYQYLDPKYSGWGGIDVYTNNSFNLNKEKTLTGEIDFSYSSPGYSANYHISTNSYLNVGVKYQLPNKKWQLALLFNDILRASKIGGHVTTQGVKESFSQYYDSQYLRFTVTYRLGNDKISVSKHEGSNSEEKGRL